MTLPELKTVLEGATGFSGKVVYYEWPEGQAPALPWICYYFTNSDPFAADGIVYHSAKACTVELYSEQKDLISEEALESALTSAGIFFTKEETHLDDEKMVMITYEMEV